VVVYVDGVLIGTAQPAEPRGDRAIGRVCARHPYNACKAGFSGRAE
jgi:hypothetical protein